ncbi:MAG TPA: hypothetical protein VHX88_06640 [Solirubrobacteraceae bacterium]|jgi:hypothetical protein|nr:hypothetical protein [Solirubrobacteraceae bacterium]
MKRYGTAALVLAGALAWPAAAAGASTLASVGRATGVVAYGGWAAWSSYDAASHGYALMLRSPSGSVAPAGVAERPAPFDVSLGPDAHGATVAVYSRCRQTACRLVELALGAPAYERRLAPPGGGSDYDPAIWGGRIAFMRAHRGGGQRRPQDIFEWVIGARHLLSFPLPRNEYSAADLHAFPQLRQTEGVTGTIGFLALHGSEIAYTRVAPVSSPVTVSDLWTQRPGAAPRLIARITTGGAATAQRSFLSPTFAGGWLYAYREGGDQGSVWQRYRLAGPGLQQASGIAFGDSAFGLVEAVVPDAAGVDWTVDQAQNGLPAQPTDTTLVQAQPSGIAWKSVKRPRPVAIGL